ncbi:MAG TPA: hypothetical protein VHL11_04315 [Phototrophicaceae bacterium]|jgi:hypothetical protein|nr:hypothetical protein [Phototrophicaceae bacterium]
MSIQLHFSLMIFMWLNFTVMFLRTLMRVGIADTRTRSGWLQLFFAALVFSLQGETVEHQFELVLGAFPAVLYLKYFGMLIWFWLYYRMLRDVFSDRTIYRFFDGWFVVVFVIGIVSLLPVLITPSSTHSDMHDVLTGLRDLLLLVPTIVIFIPATWVLWRREEIKGMKSKQFMILVCFGMYSLLAVGNIANSVFTLLHQEKTKQLEQFFAPVLGISLIAYVTLLLPYRWLTRVFYPTRLYLYWKLKHLERYVLQEVGVQAEVDTSTSLRVVNLWQLDELELAIYQAVINVLDYGALLKQSPENSELYRQIQAIAQSNRPYSELVHLLTVVKQ